jgi:hypothetical protein
VGSFTVIITINGPYTIIVINTESKTVVSRYSIEFGDNTLFEAGWTPRSFARKTIPVNDELILTYNSFVVFKDVYLTLLLHLNEDFDDDLLLDAIKLLTE